MKRIFWILLIALALALPGCSSCEKMTGPVAPVAKPAKKAPVATPAPKAKTEAKTPAKTDKTVAEIKNPQEKIKKIVPEIAKSFQSPGFKEELQEAVKSKDLRKFSTMLYSTLTDACEKQGLNFEQCIKLVNEHRDDPEVQKMVKELQESLQLPH